MENVAVKRLFVQNLRTDSCNQININQRWVPTSVFIVLTSFIEVRPTAAEWLALWSSVQQFAGSIPASGLGVCSGSESTLKIRSRFT